jgi:UDP-glucose 4-epimerase
LDIEVTEECDGCGKCVKTCFTGAIVLEDKMARITDACKGCGMCAASCHRVAIKISVSDGNRMLEEAFRRIENCADIT